MYSFKRGATFNKNTAFKYNRSLHLKEKYIKELFLHSAERSADYVGFSRYEPFVNHNIKLIAFYLPQYHPILENDQWWGKGFTEWTNVSKAVPQFLGHYQPRLPGDLGFYDLRLIEVQKKQIELAKNYGIYGFCFYYYWFGGKRLLYLPVEQYLNDKEMDLPFCLCWANENWTRRWDGKDNEILLAQTHSMDDDLNFIKSIVPFFQDSRYIKINNKPLLIVYRPSLLPNPKATAERWREYCLKNGIGEIFLATTLSFDRKLPAKLGFDAAIEFPPNNTAPLNITNKVTVINSTFSGTIYDYCNLSQKSVNITQYNFECFRGIAPSWDNEARRPGRGTVFFGSTPDIYGKWLQHLCEYTVKKPLFGERIIFVNAWNEWAEGAYLEPDKKYGYSYLETTRQILNFYNQ